MAASGSSTTQIASPVTGQDEEDTLLPKPGTKSLVWDYFGLKKDAQGKAIDDGTTC